MKKAILAVAALCMIATSAMAAGGKIGYVDSQQVFDKTKLGKKYQGIIREYFESRKKIVDSDKEEIQQMQDEYAKQRQAKVLNDKAQKEKEEAITKKMRDLEARMNEFNSEIGKKNEELSLEFNQQMVVVLKTIAKQEKFSLILNKTITILQKAEVPSVLYADDDLDLTAKVITEMDKKEDAKK